MSRSKKRPTIYMEQHLDLRAFSAFRIRTDCAVKWGISCVVYNIVVIAIANAHTLIK